MQRQDLVDKLKSARKAQGLTQADLGEKMGMTRSNAARMISNWEKGMPPNFDSLVKWIQALGFTIEIVPNNQICSRGLGVCEVNTNEAKP